jgi:acyl-CoA thioesterase I
MGMTMGRAAQARHYPLLQGCAWLACLLFTLHCPAPDAARAPSTGAADASVAQPRGERVETKVGATPARMHAERPAIVFLGTSLTAGLGLPESEAYPALIQSRVDAAGLDYRVVNAGVSGDTSAGGLRRLDWLLRLPVAVLVLELGANDMLRGQPPDAVEGNLVAILEQTRAAHPDVRFVVAGMRAAPNLGRDYALAFDAVYPRIVDRFGAAFVPFLLEDVAARPELNQIDGIHPTAEGHVLIAQRVWQTLEPVLLAARSSATTD